jgi:HSP20 family protein
MHPTLLAVNNQLRREAMTNVAVKTPEENKATGSQSLPAKRAEGSWPSLTGLRHEIDSLFDHFMRGFPGRGRSIDLTTPWKFETPFGLSSPAVDIVEKEKAYEVAAELPGLEAGDIEVSLSGDVDDQRREEGRKETNRRTTISLSVVTGRSGVRSACPKALTATRSTPLEKGVLQISLPKLAKVVEQQKTIQ